MPRRWLWGLAFGLLVGACVVALSAARYGFSAPLLLIGIVLAIAFGGLAFVGAFVGRRRSVD
jgi:TRAP-type C4-dicarboxylate transport system permease small subunit